MSSLRAICSVLLILALTSAAPVEKASGDSSSVNEVQKEEELQSLLQLADEESGRSDVTVHEEHRQHTHEINGKKMEVDTARKTVSDTKTGQVISDVKQEVSKSDDDAHPEVEVKTEVDVPSEGVHETFVQSGDEAEAEVENAEAEAEAEEIEFSPEAVAEYLYQTGDFNRFYAALAQLVNASVMTEEEAQGYSQMVALEYDRMQMEDFENSILLQRRGSSPQMLDQYPGALVEAPADLYPLPMESPMSLQEAEGYPLPLDAPEDLYALESAPGMPAGPAELVEDEFDPYELLYSLWNEAYGTGDARAEELVSELFDKVRDDNDPDDEGQVRDILLDLIASSETGQAEEEMIPPQQPQQSLYGWQPIEDVEPVQPVLMQPMGNPVASQQPMGNVLAAAQQQPIAEDEEAANELMLQNAQKRAAEVPTMNKDTKLPLEQQSVSEGDNKGNNNNNNNSNSNNNNTAQSEENSEDQEKEVNAAAEEDKAEKEQSKDAEAAAPTPATSVQKRAAETV